MVVDADASIDEVLEKLELLYQKQLSRAAVLWFGKRPQKFLFSSEIRCARFKWRCRSIFHQHAHGIVGAFGRRAECHRFVDIGFPVFLY